MKNHRRYPSRKHLAKQSARAMCGLCFAQNRPLGDGVICRPCIKLGSDGLAQREYRRAALLFRYAERKHLSKRQRRETQEAALFIEQTAGWLESIDRAAWFGTNNYHSS